MSIETAMEAARRGGQVLMENRFDLQRRQASEKSAFDYVTEVDVLAEQAILGFIRKRHPDHHILAEESGDSQRVESNSEYRWIVDPLDGTANYIHGFPFSSVSVALMRGAELIVGVVYDPLREELFHAEKGRGAFLNGEAVTVSSNQEPGRCLLATGFPFRAKELSSLYFQALGSLFENFSDFRRAGSAALDLAYVACGRVDGFWEVTLKTWDIAAGVLLIEEAGGRCTDIWGGNSHVQSGHIAASNGLIHGRITGTAGPCFSSLRTA